MRCAVDNALRDWKCSAEDGFHLSPFSALVWCAIFIPSLRVDVMNADPPEVARRSLDILVSEVHVC